MTAPTGASGGDLFPSFAEHRLAVDGAEIYARMGGTGPGLLLLHGYPQSHAMWHRIAARLARTHTVVAADLRGYGRSSCPPTDLEHRTYSKRAMAGDMVQVMRQLGFQQFSVAGHDRGARVAYRIALDAPEVVRKLVILDIISTRDQWSAANQSTRIKMFHWAFLAQPAPLPESLIGNAPDDWLDARLKRGTSARCIDVLDPRAVEDYRRYFRNSDHIHATCEDFRAGARCDLEDDEADIAGGRRIHCPTLMLWASQGPLVDLANPLDLWHLWCTDLRGGAIDAGHFLAEEKPEELLGWMKPFLAE
jgi:haloacetate dehalogenase